MITDTFFKWRNSVKKIFCHHEYVYQTTPYFLPYIDWYECRKCGQRVYNPPKELVVHDD